MVCYFLLFVCLLHQARTNFQSVFMRIVVYFLLFVLVSCSKNKDGNLGVYARVGVVELKEKDRRQTSTEDWVNNTVLLLEAKKRGFEKDLELLTKRDLYYDQLLISSFLESEASLGINISNEDIRSYYEKNKDRFKRVRDEVRIEQYVVATKKEGRRIASIFRSQKNPDINGFSVIRVLSDIVERGVFSKNIDNELFLGKKRAVGPIVLGGEISVLKVLNRHPKGSQKGLDEVFDEIYQRIYKTEASKKHLLLLDSLKKTTNIFINPEYQ